VRPATPPARRSPGVHRLVAEEAGTPCAVPPSTALWRQPVPGGAARPRRRAPAPAAAAGVRACRTASPPHTHLSETTPSPPRAGPQSVREAARSSSSQRPCPTQAGVRQSCSGWLAPHFGLWTGAGGCRGRQGRAGRAQLTFAAFKRRRARQRSRALWTPLRVSRPPLPAVEGGRGALKRGHGAPPGARPRPPAEPPPGSCGGPAACPLAPSPPPNPKYAPRPPFPLTVFRRQRDHGRQQRRHLALVPVPQHAHRARHGERGRAARADGLQQLAAVLLLGTEVCLGGGARPGGASRRATAGARRGNAQAAGVPRHPATAAARPDPKPGVPTCALFTHAELSGCS
jgi:hypothetical protein